MCDLNYAVVFVTAKAMKRSDANVAWDSTWELWADRKAQHAAALAIGATMITWSDWETAGFPALV